MHQTNKTVDVLTYIRPSITQASYTEHRMMHTFMQNTTYSEIYK